MPSFAEIKSTILAANAIREESWVRIIGEEGMYSKSISDAVHEATTDDADLFKIVSLLLLNCPKEATDYANS